MAKIKDEDLVLRIHNDLKYSSDVTCVLHKRIKEDFEFSQGNQWKQEDIDTLEKRGVKALTINKVKPIIKLITGIEIQSRSDMKVFPEGREDAVSANIATRLVKNVSKNSRIEVKHSEMFKNGTTGGMCFLEPHLDYTFDLINGDLKWRKISAQNIYLDPEFQEYDLSDSRFLIKLTRDLSKDALVALFPDMEKEIDNIESGSIDIDGLKICGEASKQVRDYPHVNDDSTDIVKDFRNGQDDLYDLIDYYYKEMQEKFFAVIEDQGVIKQFDSEEEAQGFIDQVGNGEIIKRKVPVIMLCQVVGDDILSRDVVWSYPRWKGFPIMPYFAELITEDLDDFSLKIQGIVRGIRDLNEEYNKRRTQELTHLNSSANSGFFIVKGSMDGTEKDKLKRFGSAPGFVGEVKKGFDVPTRITPMQLSQGHSQLAAEHSADMKEASSVNPDLLANDSKSQSGRAILAKQRQGLVMVQGMLDNFSETKRLTGRFILSQFNDLFTVESAMRVLGDAFIADNFTVPTATVVERALTKIENEEKLTDFEESILIQNPEAQAGVPIVDEEGSNLTVTDSDMAVQTVNTVLKDVGLNKYDVEVGEGPFEDTINQANFMDLKEMAGQGIPIPPQLLIEASQLPEAQKNKALKMLAAAAQQAPVEAAK